MAVEGNPPICSQCGNSVQEEDRFCGVCGARVTPITPEDPQVIPRPAAAAQGGAVESGNRVRLLVIGSAAALLLLLVGGGALAFMGSGIGANLFGGSDPGAAQPAPTPEPAQTDAQEPSGEEPTPVDYLQQFVSGYYAAAAREDWAATYSMLDEESEQEVTEEEWIRAQNDREAEDDLPPIESATVEGPYVSHTNVPFSTNVRLTYEDGTSETIETTLVSEEVVDEAGDYYRHLTDEEVSSVRETAGEGLEEPTTAGSASPDTEEDLEAEARAAAQTYYHAAGSQNWSYTYEHLDSETQGMFMEEEWVQKNQYYWDRNPTGYEILSVDLLSDSGEPTAEVTVRIRGEDGSSFDRTTYWVLEDGEWLHRFSQEEIDSLMPDLSYEQFVAAQQ